MTKKILTHRSENRFMKADNPKAIDVLNEIKADILAKIDDLNVTATIELVISEFKYRTTKQWKPTIFAT